jgi:uncharacterized protein (TIGR02147 family)
MPNIFEYTDYRKYLADWFREKKESQTSFSYTTFAQSAGFSDRGFFHNVIHGRRNLTKESLVKVCRATGLSKAGSEYFENLVFFNKSSDLKERNYFYEKLSSVKNAGSVNVKARQTRKDQYEFYSKWYHSAIRSLIDMYPFKDDFSWLAKNVFPQITAKQARQSVALLERLCLIEQNKDGFYRLTSKSITTGNDIVSLAVSNFHNESADLAKNALDKLPADKRNITGLTLGISKETYQEICTEIEQFRKKIVNIAERDEKADRTYQLDFYFFPITNTEIRP